MSRYGIIIHSELYHHGVKGMRWGVRNYQNPDGTLTEAGKKHYGIYGNKLYTHSVNQIPKQKYKISDEDISIGKKYYRKDGKYKVPSFTYNTKNNVKKTIESIIKYDAKRISDGDSKTGYFDGKEFGILNKKINPIHHFLDKNGAIALSYAHIPYVGHVYVKGSGNIDDINLKSIFKVVPGKVERMQSGYSSKNNYSYRNDKRSDFDRASDHLAFDKSKGLLSEESYKLAKDHYHLSDDDIKELKQKYK